VRTRGDKESIEPWDEKTGSGTGQRRDPAHSLVCLAAYLEDVNVPGTADHVDHIALVIDERVVRIAARVDGRDPFAILGLKCYEHRRMSEDRQDPLISRVERERIIGAQGPVGPTRYLLPSASIDHRNLVRVGDVDKDTLTGRSALRYRTARSWRAARP